MSGRARLLLIGLLLAFPLMGCETTGPSADGGPRGIDRSAVDGRATDERRRSDAPPATGTASSTAIRTAIKPLGQIPFDPFSLPLVSPDGRFVATVDGEPPDRATLLARRDASVPALSRLEIHRINDTVGGPSVTRQAVVDVPAVLGRAVTRDGFLIEAPQSDGSRWIGLASWTDGSVRWLVADDHVNAFASMGPGGRLAWSRRRVNDDRFELFVLNPDGSAWRIGEPGEHWLVPHWSGVDDGLFAFRLREPDDEGRLAVVFGRARSFETFRRTLEQIDLVVGANDGTAWDCMTGQVAAPSLVPPGTPDRLAFVDPTAFRQQATIWQPNGPTGRTILPLGSGSWYATITPNDRVLSCSTSSGVTRSGVDPHVLQVQPIDGSAPAVDIGRGIQVPRVVTHELWRCILLSIEKGRPELRLTALFFYD